MDGLMTKLYDISMEQIVIGCIVIEGNKLFEEVIGILNGGDFYKSDNQKCYKILQDMYQKRIPIDLATVAEYFDKNKVRGVSFVYVTHCVNAVPTTKNLHYYVKVVKDYSYRRTVLQKINKFKMDETDTKQLVEEISSILKYEEVKEKSNREIMLETIEDANRGMDFKFPENFDDINGIIGGLDRGDLVIIGGYPSNGKSSLMTELVVGFCNLGYKVLVTTLEMSPKANMRRLEANMNKINTMKFRTNSLTELDTEKIKATIPIVNDVWGYNCVRVYTIADIIRATNKFEPDILFIDYLQNISEPHEKLRLYEKATKHTLQIQQFTKEKNIVTFLLSQFHRPQEGQIHRPHNSDLRDSGAIEERADIIFLIYWERKLKMESLYRVDGDAPEYMEVNITKSKDGATGGLGYNFYPEYHRWISPDSDDKEPIIYKKAREVSGEYYKVKKTVPGGELPF